MGVWVYGCMGTYIIYNAYIYMGVWVYGCVDVWMYGHTSVYVCMAVRMYEWMGV